MKATPFIMALAFFGIACNKAQNTLEPNPVKSAPEELSPAPADAGAITLKPGASYAFIVDENVTTGFSWIGSASSDKISVEIEHRGPPKTDEPLCGAPGSAKITVTAQPDFTGEAVVTLQYKRSWEPDAIETRTFKISAVVR